MNTWPSLLANNENPTTAGEMWDENRLIRTVVENMGEGLLVADETGKILISNPSAAQILGQEPATIKPEEWQRHYGLYKQDGVTPFPLEELPLARAIRGEPCNEVVLFMRNDKTPQGKWLHVTGRPVRDDAGVVYGGVAVFRDVSEKREALEALRASEERCRLLLESTAEGIYGLDREGNCTFCNPAALRLLGFRDEAAVLGKNMHALIHHSFADGRLRPVTECSIFRAFQQGQGTHSDDEMYVRADGSFMAVEYSSFPIVRDGICTGAVVAFQDITERKVAEEALRESEQRFHAAFNRATIGMTIINREGKFVEANEAFCRMLEYSEAELRHLTFASITHPDDLKENVAIVQKMIAGEIPNFIFQKRYITKSGNVLWAKLSSSMFNKGDDHSVHVIGVVEDVTERKQAEQALADNAQQLQALFDNAMDAVIILDDEGRFVDANTAACQLFGEPKEILLLRNGREKTETAGEFQKAFEQTLKQKSYRGRHTLIRPDGKRRFVDVSATANFLPGRHLAILRDSTEQQQLEAQLRQAQKMEAVGRLAGGIAHDFNNLLNIIGGFTQLLQAELGDGNGRSHHLEEVMKATRRAAGLTRQLLAFSRKQVLAPTVLDLNTIIGDMGKMLTRLIGEDIEVTFTPAKDLGRVKVDVSQLEQVLLNLAANARDAMPTGGRLTIETRNVHLDETDFERHSSLKPGDYAMIAVTDTGFGMTEEVRSQVFEPFFTTKERGKGTGLGLATVYGIVKQSDGWIWVYSEVGVGTCFKIYFPLVQEAARMVPAKAPSEPNPNGSETVLLVEDEEALRDVGKRYLSGRGYKVLDATNGSDALRLAREYPGAIDILITDVVMPKLSGRDLAKQLCKERPLLKVIYVSGYTDDAIVHHGVLEPGLNFMQKPYSLGDLGKKVRQILDDNSTDTDEVTADLKDRKDIL